MPRLLCKQIKPTSSPDRAAGENAAADAVPDSSHGKRGRAGKATTASESRRAAKVARLTRVEETKAREEETQDTPTTNAEDEDNTQETPVATTTENVVKLLSNLWSEDRAAIQEALADLADLCEEDTGLSHANEREIHRLGGPMIVVQVVKNHVDDALIQEEGIRALCNFTYPTVTRVLVGYVGGVEVILAGMKRHPEGANIQQFGCGAIGNLLYETKRTSERVVDADGIAQVIAAMKAHPENEGVQYNSCLALMKMCEWAEYRPLIVAAGGAVTIATAMEKYNDNPRVCQAAQDAMQELVNRV
jgi:hypothetical protein